MREWVEGRVQLIEFALFKEQDNVVVLRFDGPKLKGTEVTKHCVKKVDTSSTVCGVCNAGGMR